MIVESGSVETTNVPIAVEGEKAPVWSGDVTIKGAEVTLPVRAAKGDRPEANVRVLAPEVILAANKETTKFGADAVPVVLKPGVKVHASDVQQTSFPANSTRPMPGGSPAATRPSRWRSTCIAVSGPSSICVATTIGVSLVTRPRPDAELKNLVMGLTPIPDEGPCPWYESPLLWAALVGAVLIAINIIFF